MKAFGRFFLRLLLAGIVLVLVFIGCSAAWTWEDDSKATMTTKGPHTADLNSLNTHKLPQWFADAKFGIMIHWGLYSVPGFAPKGTTFNKLLETQYEHAVTYDPYAEDYANAMKDSGAPTARFHREHYSNAPYSDFVIPFEAGLTKWDPDRWAMQFKAAGASYVVVTAKYADGYSMWPTQVRNPHAPEFHAKRDLIGELAAAVRKQGMKFGVYYSGGVDWTFQPATVKTLGDYVFLPYGEDYRTYALAQMRELISRYKPDILWNDISWPTGSKRLYALMADYYNTVPDGVVDDRWSTSSFGHQIMGAKPMRWAFDVMMRPLLSQPGAAEAVSIPEHVPHKDFRTPEYTSFDTIQSTFWQEDRGIGGSFGYNRNETEADYTTAPELIGSLANAAANNGALLLNVGPSGGEGEIVPAQLKRLNDIGAWMEINREALDGSRPWTRSTGRTAAGEQVIFTRKAEAMYVIVLGRPKGDIVIDDVVLRGTATRLGQAKPIGLSTSGSNTILKAAGDGSYAPVFRIG